MSTINSVSATETKLYQLPSQSELKKRFNEEDFDHFIEKTNLDITLGNQKRHALGVCIAVEHALDNYDDYLKNPRMKKIMRMHKQTIIQLILQNHPEAIKELKDQNILD